MRALSLWESTPPAESARHSLAPFCHDTLQFHQWMQWVFMPNIIHVIESGNDMPSSSDIFPLAEFSLQQMAGDSQQLLLLIKQFDRLISRG